MSNEQPVNQASARPVFPAPTLFLRRQIIKAAGCILLFFTAYLLLLISTTALATACIAGGVILMMTLHKVLIFAMALGMITLGVMLLLFLGQYLFGRQKKEAPLRMQLQPAEHPRLFSFIKTLAALTHTRFPKKVFAIPGVAVAGGRQLEIGLGLVNSLNISELQMMLARSQWRFSVPGMRLGNYISGLHQWIYHRLYESGNTAGIANGIQYLLKGLFGVVNRACLPLNREMELYADAAGAQIAGSKAAVSAMYRMEIGAYCMEHCLHELPRLEAAGLRFRNLYEVQRALTDRYAVQHHMMTDTAGLPMITDTYLQTFVKSRVQFRSRNASQPGLEERAQRCRMIAADHATVTAGAWELFNNPLRLQEVMSALEQAPAFENSQWYPVQKFMAELEQQDHQYGFPAAFNGYYDNRPFTPVTPVCVQPLAGAEKELYTFDTLYNPANAIRIKQFFRDRQDAETLQSITGGQIPVGQFEYDGQPYPAARATQLLHTLETAVGKEEAWLHEHDCRAFRFHYTRALDKGEQQAQALLELYEGVLLHQARAQQLGSVVAGIVECSSMLFGTPDIGTDETHSWFDVLNAESSQFKQLLREIWQHPAILNDWENERQQEAAHFLWRQQIYAEGHMPRVQEIASLQEISAAVLEQYNNYVMTAKKAYLDLALELSPEIIVHEY